jgi:hypothetical protein
MTNAIAIWIWLCAYLNCAGWFLSAIQELNATGYAIVLAIGIAALWIWIFPTGYCFVLQAGSIGNDSFAAPYALAAIDFALRSKISKRPRDLYSSVLAAALLTSAKTGNLTLLLPWAIAIFPSLKFSLQRPVATMAICLVAIFASFMPTAVLNERYCHDWSGLSLEGIKAHGNPVVRTVANIALTATQNLIPPVFPNANQWNRFIQNTIPPNLQLKLHQVMSEPPLPSFNSSRCKSKNAPAWVLESRFLLSSA